MVLSLGRTGWLTEPEEHTMIKDSIGRPIRTGDKVSTKTNRKGTVVSYTAGRRTLVDVQFEDGSVTAFYGSSLFLI